MDPEQNHQDLHNNDEYRRLLAENRRQNALLDAIFAADPGGLAVVTGPELRFAYVNPAYRYICPRLGGDPSGQPYAEVWQEEDGTGFSTQIKRVLETGKPFQTLGFVRHYPDGSRRIFTFQARRIEWENELAALLIFWDTTEFTLAQQELESLLEKTHHQTEELEGVFNAMDDAVLIFDVQGVVLHANPALTQKMGFDPTGKTRVEINRHLIIRRPDGGLVPIQQLPSVRALRGEKVESERYLVTNASGRTYSVEMTANPLYNAQQEVSGVVVVWHDITEQEQSQQALHDSEARFRASIESLLDGFAIFSAVRESASAGRPGKIVDFRYEYINQKGCQLAGRTFEELVGRRISEVEPGYRNSASFKVAIQVTESGKSVEYEDVYYQEGLRRNSRLRAAYEVNVYKLGDGVIATRRDITVRKQMEEQLRASDTAIRASEAHLRETLSRLQSVFDSSIVGIVIGDLDGNVLEANDYYLDLLGYTRAELNAGHVDWKQVTPAEYLPADYRAVQEVFARGTCAPYEKEYQRRDGSRVWVQVSLARLPGLEEQIAGCVLDITHRKQAELSLRASEERLKDFLESTHDMFFALDSSWRFVYANRRYQEMLGWTGGDLTGKNLWETFPAYIGSPVETNYRQVMQERTPAHYQTHGYYTEKWYEVSVYPTHDGISVFASDKTEEKMAAERERARAAELETLMDVVPAMIWISRDKECREMVGNRYGNEILMMGEGANISKTAPEGSRNQQPYRNFKDGHEIPPDQLPMQVAAKTGIAVRDYEFDLVFNDGTVRTVLGNVEPLLDRDGQPCGAAAAFVDITTRKRAESSLRANEARLRENEAMLIASEARYRELADSITDPFTAYDANLCMRYRNKASREATLIPDEEALGKTFAELYPDLVGSEAHLVLLRALETGQPQNLLAHWVRPQDRRAFYYDINIYPTRQGIAAFSRDVTRRVEAEQRAVAEQEWFRTTLASIGDAVITADPHGTVTYLNPVAEKLTGWSNAEATGWALERVLPLINERTGRPTADPVSKVLRRGHAFTLANHTLLIARDGRAIPIEDSAAPIKNAFGQMLGVVMVFHDVTEKRKAEAERERLLVENRRQREFMEAQSAVDPGGQAVVAGKDLVFIYTNPAYRSLTPHPEIDPPGRPYDAIWPPERGDTQRTLIEQALREGRDIHIQRHERRKADGSIHFYTFHVHPVEWEGQPAAYLVLWDTTELVRAEEAVRALQQKTQSILASITDNYYALDREWRFTAVNDRALEYYGMPREALIGKSYWETFPAVIGGIVEQQYRKAAAERVPVSFEVLSPVFWRWIEMHAYPTEDGLEIYFRDITERKVAEAQLHNSETKYRTTLASIGDAVITTDREGEVTYLNPVAEKVTGWSSAEATGQTLGTVFPIVNERTHQPAENPVGRVLESGKIVGLANHTALITRSGQEVPIEDSAAPIKDDEGRTLGIVLVFHDVTEKRKQEQQTLDMARFPAENPNPVVRIDRDGVIRYANPACAPLLKHWGCQVGERIKSRYQDFIQMILTEGTTRESEIACEGRIYSILFTPIEETGYVNGYGRDITLMKQSEVERKERERELDKLNLTLQALNKSSQAMLRAEDEISFMQEVCQIITQDCGYKMVWIGFAEKDAMKTVRPAAYAGFEEGYLETLHVTWADTERGRGPTGTAIRTGKPAMCRNMLTDPAFVPWREEALKRGYASSLVLPMLVEEKAFGAITIYASQPDAFSADEVRLLTELAADLAYGVTALRLRKAHAEAEKALYESERVRSEANERYRSLFERMTEGFALHEIICDETGAPIDYRFLEINPAFEHLTGLTQEQVKGKLMSQVEALRGDDPRWIEIYGNVALTGEPVHFENYSPALKMHYEVFAYRPAPRQFAVIFMNVTERKQALEASEKSKAQIEVQRRLIEQREQERLQIARDLHDGPVQILTGLTFSLQVLETICQDPHAASELKQIHTSIVETINDLRGYAQDLRPPALFRFGLRTAVQSYLETFRERHPELRTHLTATWQGELLPEQTNISLFRIIQESLTNVVKHAQATDIWINLMRDESQIILEVEDNGVGFAMPGELLTLARQGHLGLVGIHERAEAIGGNVEIDSRPGTGTRIQVQVPFVRNISN